MELYCKKRQPKLSLTVTLLCFTVPDADFDDYLKYHGHPYSDFSSGVLSMSSMGTYPPISSLCKTFCKSSLTGLPVSLNVAIIDSPYVVFYKEKGSHDI